MTRDDRDRLLVAGGLAWLWFVTPLTGVGAPNALLLYAALLPLLVALAAVALWRHVRAARLPLLAVALATAASAALVADRPAAAAAIVAGSLVVAAGAARLRIPPDRRVGDARSDAGPFADEGRAVRVAGDATNDPQLHALLDAAARLDRERTRVLSAAWRAVDPAARRAAWTAVRREVERTRRSALLEEVRREIELWGRAAGGSAWTWEWASMADVDRSDVRRGAMPALLDAAAATLLRDRLDTVASDVLLAPWEAAIGSPAGDDPSAEPATT